MTKYQIKPLDSQVSQEPSLIPRHPCVLNIVSPIGTGKSTLGIRLVTEDVFFKGEFHRIIIFCQSSILTQNGRASCQLKAYSKSPHMKWPKKQSILLHPSEKSGYLPVEFQQMMSLQNDKEVLKNLVESQKDFQEMYVRLVCPMC